MLIELKLSSSLELSEELTPVTSRSENVEWMRLTFLFVICMINSFLLDFWVFRKSKRCYIRHDCLKSSNMLLSIHKTIPFMLFEMSLQLSTMRTNQCLNLLFSVCLSIRSSIIRNLCTNKYRNDLIYSTIPSFVPGNLTNYHIPLYSSPAFVSCIRSFVSYIVNAHFICVSIKNFIYLTKPT